MAIVSTLAHGLDTTETIGRNLTGAIIVEPNRTYLEEDPNSPELSLGEQATVTHTFRCDYQTGLANLLGRGSYFTDSFGNLWRVLSCTLRKMPGGDAQLVTVSEGLSFGIPPDEYSVDPIEFNPSLEKNPRYSGLTDQDIANVHAALELPQEIARAEAANQNQYDPAGQSALHNLFNELIVKLRRGEDTYYVAGFKITWTSFYFLTPALFKGGIIQNPINLLPGQFWNISNGFQIQATFPNNLAWLRLADGVKFNRTWFGLTRTWLGLPTNPNTNTGYWDNDIYPFN